jgi:hypothetical protein
MDEIKMTPEMEKDIVFSKAIKAGKRIYYVDVKKNRKGELFLAVTESKKIFSGDQDNPIVNYEKHKIFLYQEDFEHFLTGLNEAVEFIRDNQEPTERKKPAEVNEDIKFDIEF